VPLWEFTVLERRSSAAGVHFTMRIFAEFLDRKKNAARGKIQATLCAPVRPVSP